MDERTPPSVGALGSLSVVLAVVAPYLLLPETEAAGLSTYYGFGIVGPWGVSLFAVVASVAFLGARQDRTDPGLVAGVTLAVGTVATLSALEWAVAVDGAVLQSITTATWMSLHRWVLVALSASIPVSSGWYARVLGLV